MLLRLFLYVVLGLFFLDALERRGFLFHRRLVSALGDWRRSRPLPVFLLLGIELDAFDLVNLFRDRLVRPFRLGRLCGMLLVCRIVNKEAVVLQNI